MVKLTSPQLMNEGSSSFLRAARAGNLEKVLEYLNGSLDINTSNMNGMNALHLASKEGHSEMVKELLKRGANVNAGTNKGNTALHIASLGGKLEVVEILVENGANVNAQSLNGFTPLYMAAQENHDTVVRYLLSHGANQSLATEDGFTPLAVALQQGHDKVVTILLENDTKGKVRLPALHIAAKKDDCKAAALLLQSDQKPDVTSKSGFTPLHIAAHYGNENIGTLLLDKGANINFTAKHKITPLHVAAKWGKAHMVQLLLDRGAQIDAATRDGLTPLHCAARSGHEPVVDLLLKRGAPYSAKTKNGLAPLHMASQGDHIDSARTLLAYKAPVDDVTVDFLTPLHVAAHCGHVKVAKLLLDHKANVNARALNGFVPLHIACKKNRIKVVELLLKHGASIEVTTESGLTPLHVASFMGCINIVIYLIQNGADVDGATVRGETPIHLAARASQSEIIKILLRNGALVDKTAREDQTALHIASRLNNTEIVQLLLTRGASVDVATRDQYTALHIASKEGHREVAAYLLEQGASLTATTKKGFTPLHLAAKYGKITVAGLLLEKEAPVDAQGKNGVTPLHVAAHYDFVDVAILLLVKGASPHATAKNGYTPLHIAAKKKQIEIATTLLEYGADTNAESKAGFTPLHLAAQEGHTDMGELLISHKANVNAKSKLELTPLHLAAQGDRVAVAQVLLKKRADVNVQTKQGYTPLHVACHNGAVGMIKLLLQAGANVDITTQHGYTPLHQAAQQGHTLVINLLLDHKASPNKTTNLGYTPLAIAQKCNYISVVETLKTVTEVTTTSIITTTTGEKYSYNNPETMQETFMTTDSEDEGGEGADNWEKANLNYEKGDGGEHDESFGFDVTHDESISRAGDLTAHAPLIADETISPSHIIMQESMINNFTPDNIDIFRPPTSAGRLKWKTFLVSFMVDARGGAMRGCRHSGVRVIIPPRKAPMPMRITCRYLRREKLIHPPPLMEGEACASRILEIGPSGAKFLGPVIIEVPHFAAMRGKEREIIILRSDDGESWREHSVEASEDTIREILNDSLQGESDLNNLDSEFASDRITRILTTDFPQYFAIITRIRQEVHAIGPEGGMVNSTVVPQVQAIFPEGALTKKIKVGLQAQPISSELVAKMLGNRVAVSPIVTVEPRRRKFHKPITLTIPVPQAATRGMINNYTGDTPTLRLLCSITGGTSKAQWEDVTGSTPLTFVNQCVSFTTTVSARFWLMDCRQINEATKFATDLYREATAVPFMSKFVVFSKRHDPSEAQMRIFCMTDDKEEKTLENQEQFTEVAKSRDVEVLEGKCQYLEFAGNLIPVTKSGEQLNLTFQAFRENRLPFLIRVRDSSQEPFGKIAFMKEPRKTRGEAPQVPICNLNIKLPEIILEEEPIVINNYQQQFTDVHYNIKSETIQRSALDDDDIILNADPSIMQMGQELGKDWIKVASHLDVDPIDTEKIKRQFNNLESEQATALLYNVDRKSSIWKNKQLCKALWDIGRKDLVTKFYPEHKNHLAEFGIKLNGKQNDEPNETIESSKSLPTEREVTLDDKDIMKDAESMDDSEGEPGILLGQSTVTATANKMPSHETKGREDEERASAVQQYLKYLEDEDREDSEERAAFRGEKTNSNELYIIKEEIQVPSGDSSSIKSTNQISITSPESTHETESHIKTEENIEFTDEGGLTHSITQVTKTTIIQDTDEPIQVQQRLQKQQQSQPQDAQGKQQESGYSNEPDTISQVSISSIPEDDKSDPTSANISSATTTTTNASDVRMTTEEPGTKITVEQNGNSVNHEEFNLIAETIIRQVYDEVFELIRTKKITIDDKEWFETEASGDVVHIIEQSTTCERTNDKSDLIADENDHEMSYSEKKDYFTKLSNDSKVKPVPPASHYCRSSSIETSGMGKDDRRPSEGEIVETVGAFNDRRAYFEATGGRRSYSIDIANMDEARTAYSTSLVQRSTGTKGTSQSTFTGLTEKLEEEEDEENNSKGNLYSNSFNNLVNRESIGKRGCEVSDVDVIVDESSERNQEYQNFLSREQLFQALNELEAEIELAQSDLELTVDDDLKQLNKIITTESTTTTKATQATTTATTTQELASRYLKLNISKTDNDDKESNLNQVNHDDDQIFRSPSQGKGTSSMRLIVRNRDEVSVKDFPTNEVNVETGEIARLLVRPAPPRVPQENVDRSTNESPSESLVVYKVWKGPDPIERCPSPLRQQFSRSLRDDVVGLSSSSVNNDNQNENDNCYNIDELVGKLSEDQSIATTLNQQISSPLTTINQQQKYLINWRSMKNILTPEGFDLIGQAIEIALIKIPNEKGYPKYYYIGRELIRSLIESSLERVLFYSIEMVRVDCVESGLINLDSPSIPGLSSVPIPYWLPFTSNKLSSSSSPSFLNPSNILTKDTWFRLVDVRSVSTQTTFQFGLISRSIQTNVSFLNPSWNDNEPFHRYDSPEIDSVQSSSIIEWVSKTGGHRRRPSVSTFRDSIDDDSYLMSADCRLTNASWAADRATQTTTSEGELFSEEYFDIDDLDDDSLKSEFESVGEDVDSDSDEMSSSELQRYQDLIAANEAIETGLMALVAGELALLTTELACEGENEKSEESSSAPPCILYKGNDIPWLDDDGWNSDEQRYTCNGKPNSLSVHRGSHSHSSDTSNDCKDNRLSDDEGEIADKSDNLRVIQDRLANRTSRSHSKHSSSSEGSVVSTGSQTDELELSSMPKYLETDLDAVEIIDGKLSFPKVKVKKVKKVICPEEKKVDKVMDQLDERSIMPTQESLAFDYQDDEAEMVEEIRAILNSQVEPGLLTRSKERSTPNKRSSTELQFAFNDRFEQTEAFETSELRTRDLGECLSESDKIISSEFEYSNCLVETLNNSESKVPEEVDKHANNEEIESQSEYESLSDYFDNSVELVDEYEETVDKVIKPKFSEIMNYPSYIIPEPPIVYIPDESHEDSVDNEQDYCWILSQYGSPKVKQALFQKIKSIESNSGEHQESSSNEIIESTSALHPENQFVSTVDKSSVPSTSFEPSENLFVDNYFPEEMRIEITEQEPKISETKLFSEQFDENNNLISSNIDDEKDASMVIEPMKQCFDSISIRMQMDELLDDNDDDQLNFDELNAEINEMVSSYDPEIDQDQYEDNPDWYYGYESQQYDETIEPDLEVPCGVSVQNQGRKSLRKQSSESIEPDYEDYREEIEMKNETSTYASQVLGAIKDKIASFLNRPSVLSDEAIDELYEDTTNQYDENNNLIEPNEMLNKLPTQLESLSTLESKDIVSLKKSLDIGCEFSYPQTIECLMMNPEGVQSTSSKTEPESELVTIRIEDEPEIRDEVKHGKEIDDIPIENVDIDDFNVPAKSIVLSTESSDEIAQATQPKSSIGLDRGQNNFDGSLMTSSLKFDSITIDSEVVFTPGNVSTEITSSDYVDPDHLNLPESLIENEIISSVDGELDSIGIERNEKSVNRRSLEFDIDEDELSRAISDDTNSERKSSSDGGEVSSKFGPSGSEYDTAVTDQSSSSYKTAIPFSSDDNSFATLQSSSSLESINSIESDKSVIYTELEPSLIEMRVSKETNDYRSDHDNLMDEQLTQEPIVDGGSDHLVDETEPLQNLSQVGRSNQIRSQFDDLREMMMRRTESLDSDEYDELTFIADDLHQDPIESFDISTEANKLKARLLDILNRPTALTEVKTLEDDEVTESSSLNTSGSNEEDEPEEDNEDETLDQLIDEDMDDDVFDDEKTIDEIDANENAECTFDEITELDTITQSFEDQLIDQCEYMESFVEDFKSHGDALIVDTIEESNESQNVIARESPVEANIGETISEAQSVTQSNTIDTQFEPENVDELKIHDEQIEQDAISNLSDDVKSVDSMIHEAKSNPLGIQIVHSFDDEEPELVDNMTEITDELKSDAVLSESHLISNSGETLSDAQSNSVDTQIEFHVNDYESEAVDSMREKSAIETQVNKEYELNSEPFDLIPPMGELKILETVVNQVVADSLVINQSTTEMLESNAELETDKLKTIMLESNMSVSVDQHGAGDEILSPKFEIVDEIETFVVEHLEPSLSLSLEFQSPKAETVSESQGTFIEKHEINDVKLTRKSDTFETLDDEKHIDDQSLNEQKSDEKMIDSETTENLSLIYNEANVESVVKQFSDASETITIDNSVIKSAEETETQFTHELKSEFLESKNELEENINEPDSDSKPIDVTITSNACDKVKGDMGEDKPIDSSEAVILPVNESEHCLRDLEETGQDEISYATDDIKSVNSMISETQSNLVDAQIDPNVDNERSKVVNSLKDKSLMKTETTENCELKSEPVTFNLSVDDEINELATIMQSFEDQLADQCEYTESFVEDFKSLGDESTVDTIISIEESNELTNIVLTESNLMSNIEEMLIDAQSSSIDARIESNNNVDEFEANDNMREKSPVKTQVTSEYELQSDPISFNLLTDEPMILGTVVDQKVTDSLTINQPTTEIIESVAEIATDQLNTIILESDMSVSNDQCKEVVVKDQVLTEKSEFVDEMETLVVEHLEPSLISSLEFESPKTETTIELESSVNYAVNDSITTKQLSTEIVESSDEGESIDIWESIDQSEESEVSGRTDEFKDVLEYFEENGFNLDDLDSDVQDEDKFATIRRRKSTDPQSGHLCESIGATDTEIEAEKALANSEVNLQSKMKLENEVKELHETDRKSSEDRAEPSYDERGSIETREGSVTPTNIDTKETDTVFASKLESESVITVVNVNDALAGENQQKTTDSKEFISKDQQTVEKSPEILSNSPNPLASSEDDLSFLEEEASKASKILESVGQPEQSTSILDQQEIVSQIEKDEREQVLVNNVMEESKLIQKSDSIGIVSTDIMYADSEKLEIRVETDHIEKETARVSEDSIARDDLKDTMKDHEKVFSTYAESEPLVTTKIIDPELDEYQNGRIDKLSDEKSYQCEENSIDSVDDLNKETSDHKELNETINESQISESSSTTQPIESSSNIMKHQERIESNVHTELVEIDNQVKSEFSISDYINNEKSTISNEEKSAGKIELQKTTELYQPSEPIIFEVKSEPKKSIDRETETIEMIEEKSKDPEALEENETVQSVIELVSDEPQRSARSKKTIKPKVDVSQAKSPEELLSPILDADHEAEIIAKKFEEQAKAELNEDESIIEKEKAIKEKDEMIKPKENQSQLSLGDSESVDSQMHEKIAEKSKEISKTNDKLETKIREKQLEEKLNSIKINNELNVDSDELEFETVHQNEPFESSYDSKVITDMKRSENLLHRSSEISIRLVESHVDDELLEKETESAEISPKDDVDCIHLDSIGIELDNLLEITSFEPTVLLNVDQLITPEESEVLSDSNQTESKVQLEPTQLIEDKSIENEIKIEATDDKLEEKVKSSDKNIGEKVERQNIEAIEQIILPEAQVDETKETQQDGDERNDEKCSSKFIGNEKLADEKKVRQNDSQELNDKKVIEKAESLVSEKSKEKSKAKTDKSTIEPTKKTKISTDEIDKYDKEPTEKEVIPKKSAENMVTESSIIHEDKPLDHNSEYQNVKDEEPESKSRIEKGEVQMKEETIDQSTKQVSPKRDDIKSVDEKVETKRKVESKDRKLDDIKSILEKDTNKAEKDRVIVTELNSDKSESVDAKKIVSKFTELSIDQNNEKIEIDSDSTKTETQSKVIENLPTKSEENLKSSVASSKVIKPVDSSMINKTESETIRDQVSIKKESENSAHESNLKTDPVLKVHDDSKVRDEPHPEENTQKSDQKSRDTQKTSIAEDKTTKKINKSPQRDNLSEMSDVTKEDKEDKKIMIKEAQSDDQKSSDGNRKSISAKSSLSNDSYDKVDEGSKITNQVKETMINEETLKCEPIEEDSIKDNMDNLEKIKDKSVESNPEEEKPSKPKVEKVKKGIRKSSIKAKESTTVKSPEKQSDSTESIPIQDEDNSVRISEKSDNLVKSKKLINDDEKRKSIESNQIIKLDIPFIGGALTWKMPISSPLELRKESIKRNDESDEESVIIRRKSSTNNDVNTKINVKRSSKTLSKKDTEAFASATIKKEPQSRGDLTCDTQQLDGSNQLQSEPIDKTTINKQFDSKEVIRKKKEPSKSPTKKTIKSQLTEKESVRKTEMSKTGQEGRSLETLSSGLTSSKREPIESRVRNDLTRSQLTDSKVAIVNYDSDSGTKGRSRRDLIPPMSPSRRPPSLPRTTNRHRSLSRSRDVKITIPRNDYNYNQQQSRPLKDTINSSDYYNHSKSNDQSLKLFTSSRLIDEQSSRLSRFDCYNQNLTNSRFVKSFRRSYESLNDIYNQTINSTKLSQPFNRWKENDYKPNYGSLIESRKFDFKSSSLSIDRNRMIRSLDYSSHRYMKRPQSVNCDYGRKNIHSNYHSSNDYSALFNSIRDRINQFKSDCRKRWKEIESDYIYHSCPDISLLQSTSRTINRPNRKRTQVLSEMSMTSRPSRNVQRRSRQSADYYESTPIRKSTSSFNINCDLNCDERKQRTRTINSNHGIESFRSRPTNSYKSTSYYSSVQDLNRFEKTTINLNHNRKQLTQDNTSNAYLRTLGPIINSNPINQFNYRPARFNSTKLVNYGARRRESSSPPSIGFNCSSVNCDSDYHSTWNLTYGSENISPIRSVNQSQLRSNLSSTRDYYISSEKLANYDYDRLTISRSYINLTDSKSYLNDLEWKIVRARSNWSRTESTIKVSNHDKPLIASGQSRKRFITSR